MPGNSDKQWYYAQNRQRFGPVTAQTLAHMYLEGDLQDQDLVWCASMEQWQRAGKVKNLFLKVPAPPPPPEPQPVDSSLLSDLPLAEPYEEAAAGASGPTPAAEPYVAAGTERVVMQDTFEYGGFFARLAAFLVDAVILTIIEVFIIGLTVTVIGVPRSEAAENAAGLVIWLAMVAIVFVWLYYALQESGRHCATFGKRVLGLAVTDLSGNGVNFWRATARHFSKIISGMICGMGYLFIIFTARKQALHDIIAGCMIIK